MLRGMWDLPGSGIEPIAPALAGRFFTTEPPDKPGCLHFLTRLLSDSSVGVRVMALLCHLHELIVADGG